MAEVYFRVYNQWKCETKIQVLAQKQRSNIRK